MASPSTLLNASFICSMFDVHYYYQFCMQNKVIETKSYNSHIGASILLTVLLSGSSHNGGTVDRARQSGVKRVVLLDETLFRVTIQGEDNVT